MRKELNLYNLNTVFIAIILSSVILKEIFVFLSLEKLPYVLIAFIMFINIAYLINHNLYRFNGIYLAMFFLFSGLLAFTVSFFSSINMAVIGLVGGYIAFIMWVVIFMGQYHQERHTFLQWYIRFNIYLAIISSVGAVYQFFFDYSLLGFNTLNPAYSNIDNIDIGVTKRATSFMGGPQNLGLYLAIMSVAVFMSELSRPRKRLLSVLFFTGGMLTGSAAFLAFIVAALLTVYAVKSIRSASSLILFVGVLSLFVALVIIQMYELIDFHNTALEAFYVIDIFTGRISKYSLDIFLSYDGLLEFIFGHGIGVTDRLVEILMNGHIPDVWQAGNESYLVKIYYEQGILGLISFVLLFLTVLLKAILQYRTNLLPVSILSGLFTNMLFTTSLAGLTMSIIVWPFILWPMLQQKYERFNQAESVYYSKPVWDSNK